MEQIPIGKVSKHYPRDFREMLNNEYDEYLIIEDIRRYIMRDNTAKTAYGFLYNVRKEKLNIMTTYLLGTFRNRNFERYTFIPEEDFSTSRINTYLVNHVFYNSNLNEYNIDGDNVLALSILNLIDTNMHFRRSYSDENYFTFREYKVLTSDNLLEQVSKVKKILSAIMDCKIGYDRNNVDIVLSLIYKKDKENMVNSIIKSFTPIINIYGVVNI